MLAADNVPAVVQGTVVIVDAAPIVSKVVAQMVTRCGFAPHIVDNGLEALRIVHAATFPICCAFVGVSLRPIDGIIIADLLASHDPALPVVLMSGYPAWSLAARLKHVPAAYFLAKPFTLAQVCTLLAAIIPLHTLACGEPSAV